MTPRPEIPNIDPDDDEVMGHMIRAAANVCRRMSPTGWTPSDLVIAAMLASALRTARQLTEGPADE